MLVNIPNIREQYLYDREFRQSILQKPFNYILSGKDTLVAYIKSDNSMDYYISVLDIYYNPIFTYQSDAYIAACNISSSGDYIVWHTGNSVNYKSNEQNSIFLFNVLDKKLNLKIEAPVSSEFLSGIFVDIQPGVIEIVYGEIVFKYTYNGEPIDYEKSFKKLLKSTYVNPYVWNDQALKIIDALECEFDKGIEDEVLCRIKAAENNPEMSHDQLSQTYKKLGNCYLKHQLKEKALRAYRKGLSYNDKLGVKKAIKKLEEELGHLHREVKYIIPKKITIIYKDEETKLFDDIETFFELPLNDVPLTPYEIKLLDYINGMPTKNFRLPGYFTYEYNLKLNNSFKNIITGGYINTADIYYSLNKASVESLKNFLNINNLPKLGKKNVLIVRITDNFSENELSDYFDIKYFTLTTKGLQIIEQNQHILFAHTNKNHLNIDIDEICKYRTTSSNEDFHDDFIDIILDRAKNNIKNKDWGLYRNNLLELSYIYESIKKHYIESICLLYVCFADIEGSFSSYTFSIVKRLSDTISRQNIDLNTLKDLFLEYNLDAFPHQKTKEEFFDEFIKEL